MKIGVRGKLFVLSIAIISTFGLASGAFLEARLRSAVEHLGLPPSQLDVAVSELRTMFLVAALVGLLVAGAMSVIASELISRTLRELLRYTRAVVSGEAPTKLTQLPSDEVGRLAESVKRIAEDLHSTVTTLATERDRLQAILLTMHDAVVVLDDKQQITLVNGAACKLLALDSSIVGSTLDTAVQEPELDALVRRGLAGEPASRVLRLGPAPRHQVQADVVPLASLGVVVLMHDMTDLRRLETMRRDFVGNVSHELRTPVSVIRVNAETLLDGALDDEDHARRFVARILRSAERLSHLVTDLLDLSRIEAGHYATKMDRISVRDALDVVIEDVKVQAAARDISVELDVPHDVLAQGDATALEQVLQNLIDNAVGYTPQGGHVWVRAVHHDAERVRIEVADDGPGIAPQHQSRVFERFYRVDPGRSREMGGTGLGLSIVKHLVESMSGQVGVGDASSGGALFWVELRRPSNTSPPVSANAETTSPHQPASPPAL